MNTRKQVLIMTALLAMMLIIVGGYAAWMPSRQSDAQVEFDQATAERGSLLFARNCRLCHGDVGEGGALGARYAGAPALDRPDLQGFTDVKVKTTAAMTETARTLDVSDGTKFKLSPPSVILVDTERMQVSGIDGNTLTVARAIEHTEAEPHPSGADVLLLDAAVLKDKMKLITNTITCGRVGTAMPAWAQTQGGPLSDEQIRQLMTLITQGRWDLVKEEVDKEDLIKASLTNNVPADATAIPVSDVTVFNAKDAIRIGDERIRITAVPTLQKDAAGNLPKDKSGIIIVQRGVLGTTPLDHEQTEVLYKFPENAGVSINQASCGQTAQAPAPAGTPELIEPFTGQTVNITAQNVQFDKKDLAATTGGKIRVRLDNKDAATEHNIAFYKSSTDLSPVSTGSVGTRFPGVAVDDTAFDVPAAGSYFFRCDVHPTIMVGTFTVK